MNLEFWTYTYDASGNELTFLWQDWSNNQWMNSGLYTYIYTASGNELSALISSWSNEQWVKFDTTSYTYDENGELSRLQSFIWSGPFLVPKDSYFSVTDGAANYYSFTGYDIHLTHTNIVTGISSHYNNLPLSYSLYQNYPNPFNPTTSIHYQLPRESFVHLSLFNVLGQEVRTLVNETEQAGYSSASFDGSNLPSGIYFYRITAGSFTDVKKMVLLR